MASRYGVAYVDAVDATVARHVRRRSLRPAPPAPVSLRYWRITRRLEQIERQLQRDATEPGLGILPATDDATETV